MDGLFTRLRGSFAPYSGLVTLAGIAMIIVFGTKYIQYRNTLDAASPESATAAVVREVRAMTCTKSLATSIQAFNAQQRCLDVTAALEGEAAPRHIIVEQTTVGELAAGDRVYVLAAPSGVNGYLIVKRPRPSRFFPAPVRRRRLRAAGRGADRAVVPAAPRTGTGPEIKGSVRRAPGPFCGSPAIASSCAAPHRRGR